VHEVTGHVEFSTYFQDEPPMVWIRERSTKGWSGANPNSEMPWVKITNVTQSGFDFKTFAYYVESDVNGRQIDSWYPASPSNMKIAYTAVGDSGPPPLKVFLSGPTQLDSGEEGTWTASVSGGGSGNPSYDWEYRPAGSYSWYDKSCTGSSCSHTFYGDGDTGGIRVTVTKGSESDQATTIVYVSPLVRRADMHQVPNGDDRGSGP